MGRLPETNTTNKVFQAIIEYKSSRDGNSPTVRELVDITGISSTSVVEYHLRKLAEQGRISRNPSDARNITVIGGQWSYAGQGQA